jgi:hypothetical protein
MREPAREELVKLRGDLPIWERVFTVSPLVLVGTREESGDYDLAPKHMVLPLGWGNYFGFACTPTHGTYANVQREGVFTVSYPRPTQVVVTSLAAAPREPDGKKPAVDVLSTFPASEVDGVFVRDGYLFLSGSWTVSWTTSARTAWSAAGSSPRTPPPTTSGPPTVTTPT